jgi:hypothetical protein
MFWLASATFFALKANKIGKQKQSSNDGCYLQISTTVFTMIGGSIGLLIFQAQFPWYILTSLVGCVLVPWLVCRVFIRGKRKY